MKQANVFYNGILAGILIRYDNEGYFFSYDQAYLANKSYPSISVHFPKDVKKFNSRILFPFFFNMLSEGANKRLQLQQYKIEEFDYIELLIKTASNETIGAVTVGPA
jgi:serine/threonine-protein kinase HipA